MTSRDDHARLTRLHEVRQGIESLHAQALAERAGQVYSVEETVERVRRHDLALEAMPSWGLDGEKQRPSEAPPQQ
ncbi:hypothetical protein KZC52_07010 [Microbacterium sp. kSW2-24]|uniref:hypothetical protein n=1 Tax=Microbacterium galbinum TaxID=2851646 RepID=UPI001FFCB772|nr:hypothetical protein [Microbacterium galbinum]MCK2022666.1 hypothetical protein [Microbacterium galbinum]